MLKLSNIAIATFDFSVLLSIKLSLLKLYVWVIASFLYCSLYSSLVLYHSTNYHDIDTTSAFMSEKERQLPIPLWRYSWKIKQENKEIIKICRKEDNFSRSNREKSNIAIAILEKLIVRYHNNYFVLLGAPIIFSSPI